MSLRHLFLPQTIRFPDSQYNHHVSVVKYATSCTLFADGLIESGDIMRHIWKFGLDHLLPSNYIPQSILLLGLAGGSNAHLVSRCYPSSSITAVEIDPQMINIGHRYFHTDQIKNLKIIKFDAYVFARQLKPQDHFDLVLVDCFCGQEIPQKLQTLSFIKNLYRHSNYLLINRLWHANYQAQSRSFLRRLETEFDFVTTFTGTNLVVLVL